jgi:hypothetical protein
VVGQVRVTAEARVSQPKEGLFRMNAGALLRDFASEESAIAAAEIEISRLAAASAVAAGAADAEVSIEREIKAATVEGSRSFIEALLVATASGRPRVAV